MHYLKTIQALNAEGGGNAAAERAIETARGAARDALASGLEVGAVQVEWLKTMQFTLSSKATWFQPLSL